MSTTRVTSEAGLTANDRRRLRRWSRDNGREHLPWRVSRDPYEVLVSEVMLQQTQVARVVPYYGSWLERWPTVGQLSSASPADVIRVWSGLGYNRRALRLRAAAIAVSEELRGTFPSTVPGLRLLPGVGAYTAAAVASFAFERRVAVADTNIARVLARCLLGQSGRDAVPPRSIRLAAQASLPRTGVRAHNLALMDLGATICRPRNPDCPRCPLRSNCLWLARGSPVAKAQANATPKFRDTARFARGRIVDALRKSVSLAALELLETLPQHHRARLAEYLSGLEQDGLIEQVGRRWRLPEATK